MADAMAAGKTIRIIRPSLAWIAACAASGLSLVTGLGLASFAETIPDAQTIIEFLTALLPASLFVAIFIGMYTLIPTFAAAWLMHALRWRAVWISALLGGMTGAALIQILSLPRQYGPEGVWITAFFASVGLVGGAVYRLVAGKH